MMKIEALNIINTVFFENRGHFVVLKQEHFILQKCAIRVEVQWDNFKQHLNIFWESYDLNNLSKSKFKPINKW